MKKQIFKSNLAVGLITFVACIALFTGALYQYFTGMLKDQMKTATELVSVGVIDSGREYLDQVSENEDLTEAHYNGFRITWIDKEGNVIFESTKKDPATLENHMDREEVKEAMDTGYGESSRYSKTLLEQLFYTAKKLPDGSVVRLAGRHNAVWTLMFGLLSPIIFLGLLAVALSLYFASRLSRKVMEPINSIDLDKPLNHEDSEIYDEIKPLLVRIGQQNAQIERDKLQLKRASDIRQEFTANVSHELKTPLHSISGYAELIKEGLAKPEDVKPFAEKIYSESLRLAELVEDTIELSHLEADAYDTKMEEADVYTIAKNAVDSLSKVADDASVTVSIKGDPVRIQCVPHMVYMIVYNLLDNAIKYNVKDGKVDLLIKNRMGDAFITIKDTGIGVPEEDIDRLYERFYRVDKSRSNDVDGTGLGLSIVKHAVNVHGGTIHADSKQGVGTTFEVYLPKEHWSE